MGSRGKSLSVAARGITEKSHNDILLSSSENALNSFDKEALFDELRNAKVKFSEADTIFITRDQIGKITWLENGNMKAGLKHITERHTDHFKQAFGIKKSEIPYYIQEVIKKGTITYSTPVKGGTRREYLYKGMYLTVIITGSNGFIVTAFPSTK